MGTELVKRLLGAGHEVAVWNRTLEKTAQAQEAGANVTEHPGSLADAADLVMTCLFGPAAIQETVLDGEILPAGAIWVNITTESPAQVTAEAEWAEEREIRYVHSPVVGTLAPARKGTLGVYVGGADPQARELAAQAVSSYADPDRLQLVETAAEAATAKLIANLALIITAQGVAEALRLGLSNGISAEQALGFLANTSLDWMVNFKRDFILGRDTEDAQFTTDAIAKDARLMINSSDFPLPAVTAGLEALSRAQQAGYGEHDFSVIMRREAREN